MLVWFSRRRSWRVCLRRWAAERGGHCLHSRMSCEMRPVAFLAECSSHSPLGPVEQLQQLHLLLHWAGHRFLSGFLSFFSISEYRNNKKWENIEKNTHTWEKLKIPQKYTVKNAVVHINGRIHKTTDCPDMFCACFTEKQSLVSELGLPGPSFQKMIPGSLASADLYLTTNVSGEFFFSMQNANRSCCNAAGTQRSAVENAMRERWVGVYQENFFCACLVPDPKKNPEVPKPRFHNLNKEPKGTQTRSQRQTRPPKRGVHVQRI